ncbi:MAG TPA: hypothetical protein VGP22_07325, partial [Albitalea sp.]|nr:hypothetical protein [Albitalea sp.]
MPSQLLVFIRPLLVAIGVLAACVLLWFAGPLVAFAGVVPLAGERARWAAVGVVVLLALGHAAWQRARAAARNRRL